MKNFSISFLAIITLFLAHSAIACEMRDLIYTSGEYEFSFDQWDQIKENQRSATMFPFKITNKKANLSFEGIIGYGNGYSYPQVGINLCANKDEEYKKSHEKSCGYSGTVYEINGTNTKHAFQTNGDQTNPILFPNLNVKFYYARNGLAESWGTSDIPGDVWIYQGCKK